MNRRTVLQLFLATPVLAQCGGSAPEYPKVIRIHGVIPNALVHYYATGEKMAYIETENSD